MLHPWVNRGHEIEGLHDVRAVVAAQRDEGFEFVVAGQIADLLDHAGVHLGWIATHLQKRQNERGELVAHGQASKSGNTAFVHIVQRCDTKRWLEF